MKTFDIYIYYYLFFKGNTGLNVGVPVKYE